MSTTILKPHEYSDFYIVWESIVESPIYWGTRAELLAEMDLHHGPDPARFDRADQWGTSALWPDGNRWDDPNRWEIYEQKGFLRVIDMPAFVDSWADNDWDDTEACKLLIPLED